MARKKCAYDGCSKQEQQAGVCLIHYWEEYRAEAKFSGEDFWEFVKKELRIDG